jgi:hypothetical protein
VRTFKPYIRRRLLKFLFASRFRIVLLGHLSILFT